MFESVLFRIFDDARHAVDPSLANSPSHTADGNVEEVDQDAWLYETCTLALQLVVDLFVSFYDTVNPLLKKILSLLVSLIKRPHQSLAGIGIAAFVRLMSNAGELFSEEKWFEVVLSLKEVSMETLPDFSFVLNEDDQTREHEEDINGDRHDESTETITSTDDMGNLSRHRLYAAINDVKCRAAIQLLLIQVHNITYKIIQCIFAAVLNFLARNIFSEMAVLSPSRGAWDYLFQKVISFACFIWRTNVTCFL